MEVLEKKRTEIYKPVKKECDGQKYSLHIRSLLMALLYLNIKRIVSRWRKPPDFKEKYLKIR